MNQLRMGDNLITMIVDKMAEEQGKEVACKFVQRIFPYMAWSDIVDLVDGAKELKGDSAEGFELVDVVVE